MMYKHTIIQTIYSYLRLQYNIFPNALNKNNDVSLPPIDANPLSPLSASRLFLSHFCCFFFVVLAANLSLNFDLVFDTFDCDFPDCSFRGNDTFPVVK